MKKTKLMSAAVTFLSMAGLALTAQSASALTISAYEVATSWVFSGTGAPGSTITVKALLFTSQSNRTVIGSKDELCIITGYNSQGQSQLWCNETLIFNGKGAIASQGNINQTLLEAGVPQTIAAWGTTGIYAGKAGTQKIQQIVFPAEFQLTVILN